MRLPSRTATIDWVKGSCLWLCVAISLGCYYIVTYFGAGEFALPLPMPTPEAASSFILFHFSEVDASKPVRALQWCVGFPLIATLWVAILTLTAPYFEGRRTKFSDTYWDFSLAAIPLIIPAPSVLYVLWEDSGGGVDPGGMAQKAYWIGFWGRWPWMTPIYLGLAVAALILQVIQYRRAYGLRGKKACRHFIGSVVLLILATAGLGALAGDPLRYFFE